MDMPVGQSTIGLFDRCLSHTDGIAFARYEASATNREDEPCKNEIALERESPAWSRRVGKSSFSY
jgi:hypothetical protein